jgi:hypothetical protein
MTNRIPLIVNEGDAQIQELGTSDNLIVAGNILAGGYYYANGQPFVPGGNTLSFVTSNVTAVVAGQPLIFEVDYGNSVFPGGVFTLVQANVPPPPPISLTLTDTWQSGGTTKNQYTDFANAVVNTQGITLNITLTGTTFNVQNTDSITIGNSVITGSNLIALGISGTGGTYVIPAASFDPNIQTELTTGVSASLSALSGVLTATGTTLTTVPPVPFNIASLTGSFPNSSVTPATVNQSFNWSATGIVGTIISGTVTLSGSQTATLTNVGGTSGVSQIYDSTVGPFILTSSYTGQGLNGAGTRTVTPGGSVTPATSFTPLYWKTTTSSLNPNFTIADNRYNVAYAPDQGQGAATTNVTTNWTWIAIPAAGPGPVPPGFWFDQPPFIGIVTTPDQVYNSQDIGGATYNVYGFTNYSLSVFIYTVSTT